MRVKLVIGIIAIYIRDSSGPSTWDGRSIFEGSLRKTSLRTVDERNPTPLKRYFAPGITGFVPYYIIVFLYIPVVAEISSIKQGHFFMSFGG